MRQTDTGALIAQLRKEQGLTQKQLAEQLHISDRTISKWERGAGFPDVSLLEPLADALRCSVVSLLEGRLVEEPAEIDVRSALAVLIRESRSALRRDWSRRFGILCCLLMAGFVIFGILDRSGAFLQKGRTVLYGWNLAGWRENRRDSRYDFRGANPATLAAKIRHAVRWAVCHRRSCEKTCRERHAGNDHVGRRKDNCRQVSSIIAAPASVSGAQCGKVGLFACTVTGNLDWFALSLEDGRIIASDQGWAQLQALRPYEYPVYVN